MDVFLDSIKDMKIASFFNVSPDLPMLYRQICLMKCYFCLYIFQKEKLEPLRYLAYVFAAFYTSFVLKDIDLAWAVVLLNIYGSWLGASFSLFDLITLVRVTLSLKGLEFFVDCMLITYLPFLLSRINFFTLDLKKTVGSLLWIAFILSIPFFPVLCEYANNYVFIYFLVAGTFYVGSLHFPEGKWAYILLTFVYLKKEAL